MEQPECSETSAHKIQTPGNNPKERIRDRKIIMNKEIQKRRKVGRTWPQNKVQNESHTLHMSRDTRCLTTDGPHI